MSIISGRMKWPPSRSIKLLITAGKGALPANAWLSPIQHSTCRMIMDRNPTRGMQTRGQRAQQLAGAWNSSWKFSGEKNEENDEETDEEQDHQEKKFSEVAVARPPKMRKLSWKACLCCMKNHLTSLGRSLGLSIHFTKRPTWSSASTTYRLYFLFFFLKRSGCCSWVGVRANRSLPQVVLLPAGTWATCANAAKDRLDRKKPVSASLETELESQPQNMINFNEVAKDACLPPDFVRA